MIPKRSNLVEGMILDMTYPTSDYDFELKGQGHWSHGHIVKKKQLEAIESSGRRVLCTLWSVQRLVLVVLRNSADPRKC